MTAPELRPYQHEAIARIRDAIAAGHRRILLVVPTGGGKTVISAAMIAGTVERGRRSLFLAHRRELITQASAKLYAAGVDHGVLLPGFPHRPDERVQVASVWTAHSRAVRASVIELPEAQVVFVDEAHHSTARTYRDLLDAYPHAVIVGITATPCRGDGRGLGDAFEILVEGPPIAELIRDGYLVGTKVYAPFRPDLAGVAVQRGDYVERQLAERMDKGELVGDIVEHHQRLAEHRPTVVFAASVGHSVHLRDEFCRSGVLAEHIDGTTPSDERDAILARLASGNVEVVCNYGVLTEGWDSPTVSCVVLARPTKHHGLFRQMVGRVLRPAPGKTDALVLDHAGAVFEHGFIEEPVRWTLSPGKRAENPRQTARAQSRAPALTTCPECSAVRFEGHPCPACHWRPQRKPEAVEVADGELGLVDRNRVVKLLHHTADDRLRFYQGLLYIAMERGYARGWAAHKYREKFKDWPTVRRAEPKPPDPATRSWVRSRQIAYAKALEKQGAGAA
jgi:DNA repair protein RadD